MFVSLLHSSNIVLKFYVLSLNAKEISQCSTCFSHLTLFFHGCECNPWVFVPFPMRVFIMLFFLALPFRKATTYFA